MIYDEDSKYWRIMLIMDVKNIYNSILWIIVNWEIISNILQYCARIIVIKSIYWRFRITNGITMQNYVRLWEYLKAHAILLEKISQYIIYLFHVY